MTKQPETLPARTEAAPPAVYTPMSILATAVERGVDVAQLEKLMDLQERWEAREAKKAFDKSLAAFKAEKIIIEKTHHVHFKSQKTGMVTDYWHEGLPDILAAINPVLSKNGLSLTWRTSFEGGKIRVDAFLSHELGHCESTHLAADADTSGNKNSLQAMGSTISYLKRYTGSAITGIAAGDVDDDGEAGGEAADNAPKQNKQQAEDPNRQPNMQALQPWLDWLGQFKIGVHTADQTEKAWNGAAAKREALPEAERKYLTAQYDAKITAMVEAEKK